MIGHFIDLMIDSFAISLRHFLSKSFTEINKALKKIFLITKLKTTNIGNEALSHEIIKLFSTELKDAIININGRPMGLEGYLPTKLARAADPIKEFEKWTDIIVNKISKETDLPFENNNPKVQLIQSQQTIKSDKWKAYLRPLKNYLNSFYIYKKQYAVRASKLKQSNWLVYSGAGEVNDGYRGNFKDAGVLLRQLIEIRVAQKLNIKTAAINQSVFVNLRLGKKLLAHVYSKMNKIVVRGESSKKLLLDIGVPENIIDIAPDSAINTKLQKQVVKTKNKIGLNFSNHVHLEGESVKKIIEYLRSLGKDIYYCTNEPSGDRQIIKMLQSTYNIPVLEGFKNYIEYAEQLSSLEFVISARVHTNMLTLISGTKIIPIEGSDFRLAELLEGFEYPIKITKSNQKDWHENVIAEIDNVIANKYDFENFFSVKFPKQILLSRKNTTWLNNIG